MTWTKTSDDYPDDCWTLSDRAYRLHHEGLTWSNRKLLDCRIPKDDLRRFARHGDDGVAELLACGWWREVGPFYEIVHHATYQRTRDEVLAQQEANTRNGRKGGRPRKPPREIVENPVENPVGSPTANPEGQVRTGLAWSREGSTNEIPVDDPDTLAEWEADEASRAAGDAA